MASRLNDVGAAVSGTLLPLYSEHYGRSGLQEVGRVFAAGLKYLQILMVPICMLGFVMAKPLTLLIYGSAYLPLVLPLKILIASIALTSLGAVNSTLLLGAEKQSFIAKFGTVTAVLNITLDLLLIPTHGALGAAIANCSAQIIGAIGGTMYTLYYVKVRFPWKATATIYCAAAAAVTVPAYYFGRDRSDAFTLAWTLAAAALIYVTTLVATGELGKRDVNLLRRAFLQRASETSAPETIPVS
jgi:O-antigen/teichoic acid export membrane protein